MSNVIGLRGAVPLGAGIEPNAELVEFIDKLMQDALAGRMQGIAVVEIDTIGSVTTHWCAAGVDRHFMLSGASMLQHRLCNHVLGEAE